MEKCRKVFAAAAAMILLASACASIQGAGLDGALADETVDAWITLAQDNIQIQGSGATVSGNTVTILVGGTYGLRGLLTEGQVVVDARGQDTVKLLLSGAEVRNSTDAALRVSNAGSTILLLDAGTENCFQSGQKLDVTTAQKDDSAAGGAIYARDDLTIQGSGTLIVGGYINNGIHTTNALVVEGGDIRIEALNDGLKGKDSVTVRDGSIVITAGGDGIQANDTTGEGYGTITLEGGSIQIVSQGDGIQAETALTITAGEIDVTAGGGSGQAQTMLTEKWGKSGRWPQGWDMEEEDTVSAKGLKSGTALTVSGGEITVDTKDDGLHSNGTIRICGGGVAVSSGDDGIHADDGLWIEAGEIQILQSYEGLEANQITLSGGNISIVSSDDGVNANGGSAAMGGRGGMASGTAGEMPNLIISGGTLRVNAEGDGLDSNGNLLIQGGVVVVDGPQSSGNGALDSGSESGGVCQVSGGTVLAIGAAGMAESFGEGSAQCSFFCTVSGIRAGSQLTIQDSEGQVLFTHTAAKSASSVVFSSPELRVGQTYTLTVDGQPTQITQTAVTTGAGGYGPNSFMRRGW